ADHARSCLSALRGKNHSFQPRCVSEHGRSGRSVPHLAVRKMWLRRDVRACGANRQDALTTLECGDLSPLWPFATCRDGPTLSSILDDGARLPINKAVKRGPQSGSPAGVLARSPHSKRAKDGSMWMELARLVVRK